MNTAEHLTEVRRPYPSYLWRRVINVSLLGVFVLVGALIVAYDALIPSQAKVSLEIGQVAPRDVLAPRSLQYESDVLTQAKRDAEIAAVRPIFDPPDPNVENQQAQLARQMLDYIENVRYDDFATPEQKRADIAAISGLKLDSTVVDAILSIEDDTTWRAIDAQIIRLLERVMSGEVREDNIQAKRDNLPNLISTSYSETEVKIIRAIVSDLIRPNAFYNEGLTRQAQAQAAENVPVEMRTFVRGQMIIREGEIATAAHIEALDRFGLLQATKRQTSKFIGGLLAMALITALLSLYIRQFYQDLAADSRFLTLLGAFFLLFLAGARVFDSQGSIQPYYYPASALAFLIATVVGTQLAILVTFALAGLVGLMNNNSLELTLLIGFGGALGVLGLGQTDRLNAYFKAGGIVGISGACIAILFGLIANGSTDLITVLAQIVGSVANGVFSAAVALVGLYVVTNTLNIPTSLKIVELMQPNHPLLQRLLREAPGTYQHSLQVANLAELGAEQIKANAALLRVAAMYHDVGKILNPHFFVENQAEVNPHDQLDDPQHSARIIIGHVTEGDRLARRYRLPNRIREFIMEHHGTMPVIYFYQKAVQAAGQAGPPVEVSQFSYPGPRPQSRETAILMLADGCESSVRARRPQSKRDIEETVNYIFETRLHDSQLDESGLTLNDLRVLRETFQAALQGLFHTRISYPGAPGQDAPATPAAAPSGPTAEQLAKPPGQGQTPGDGRLFPANNSVPRQEPQLRTNSTATNKPEAAPGTRPPRRPRHQPAGQNQEKS